MTNKIKSNLSEEYLRQFRHRVNYVVNESPKYRPLVGTSEEFDEMPTFTNEAGEQDNIPKPPKPEDDNTSPESANNQSQEINSPVPAFDAGETSPDEVDSPIGDPMTSNSSDMPSTEMQHPENQVNDIQNEIIKHNIEAMKSIHSQLESLNNTVLGLNNKLNILTTDVEEVREPSNSEKLMNKTNVSYPYYFNLNDLWHDNWFDKKHGDIKNEKGEVEVERGIRELPDGSFIADFDELPKNLNIEDSFNDIK
jgi:hypothetical protein